MSGASDMVMDIRPGWGRARRTGEDELVWAILGAVVIYRRVCRRQKTDTQQARLMRGMSAAL